MDIIWAVMQWNENNQKVQWDQTNNLQNEKNFRKDVLFNQQ